MISVSRLGGKVFYLNADMIEVMEETPDTVITLVDGTKYIVSEGTEEIIAKIIAYRREVFTKLPTVYKE